MTQKMTMSIKEVSEALGISRNMAYSMVREKKLPAIRIGQRRLVVPVAAIQQLLSQH